MCTQYLVELGSAETLLDIAQYTHTLRYREEIAADGEQGLRHLALAAAEIHYTHDFDLLTHENQLRFLGFVALSDPLRPSTRHTVELVQELGVAIKILTGDSREVAGYVARQIGLLKQGEHVFTGDELATLTPETLKKTATEANVFARVTPEDKYRLIEALKKHHVVGYQGDGINDGPALTQRSACHKSLRRVCSSS